MKLDLLMVEIGVVALVKLELPQEMEMNFIEFG